MNIPNLTLDHDRILDPLLATVLGKLSLDKPNWYFAESKDKYNRDASSRTVSTSESAPEGKLFTCRILVKEDNRTAGTITVFSKYSRGGREPAIEIKSDRIDNGRRGTRMTTTKVDVAVRNIKKYFEAPKTGEMLYEAEEESRDDLRRSIYQLQNPINNGHVFSSVCQNVAQFVYATLTDQPIHPGLHDQMKKTFLSKSFEDQLANYELGERMKHKTYTALREDDGGFYLWEDEAAKPKSKDEARSSSVVHLTYEQLPEWMQNKVAVLRLLENKELALDVGFKVGDNMFLVAHD